MERRARPGKLYTGCRHQVISRSENLGVAARRMASRTAGQATLQCCELGSEYWVGSSAETIESQHVQDWSLVSLHLCLVKGQLASACQQTFH